MSTTSSEDVAMADALDTPPPNDQAVDLYRGMSGTEIKKLKARERALVRKFGEVTEAIVNQLEEVDPGVILSVYHNTPSQSAELNKEFQFDQLLKLTSDQPFRLMGMVNMGQANHSGMVAIIVKQTLPFELMKLPKPIRERIYTNILCDESRSIRVKTRGGSHKSSHAPNYSGPHRLAILCLNRQVREEALPIMFNQKFIMETTYSLQNWLLQIETGRQYVTKIILEMYERKTAQPAFLLLRDCKLLKRFRFDHVSSNSQITQALKVIWADAEMWFTSFNNPGPHRKDANAVMDIISFGSNSFHSKVVNKTSGEVVVKKWGHAEHGALLTGLKKKLLEANRKTDLQLARR